ncbi:U-box domain-containing protein 62-like [Chenopodium quinoa]|uniref:U-box domain-containing protein 62-like n=1 Tax=Chenopodium quinoa TaxID=63459 RepID=UPI000B78C8FF|nr:U-box domain-containing protein 62-like [Chenopodium quinoa]
MAASENTGLVPTQRMEDNLNSQLLYQSNSNPLRFGRGPVNPGSKLGYMDNKLFNMDHRERGYFSPELRRGGDGVGVYEEGAASPRRGGSRDWNGGGPASTPSSGEDDEEEDEDDDEEEEEEEDEEGDGEVLGLVGISGGRKNSHSSGCGGSSSGIGDKIGVGNSKDHVSFGSSTRQIMIKDGGILQPGGNANRVSTSENDQQGRVGNYQKMVTVAEHDGGDVYYMQLLQGTEGCSQGQKDIAGDNGCGFNGRKDIATTSDPGESLRAIFSDPITGALMDDAMILPCGHSFGGGGIQQVIKMKACYTCSNPVTEELVAKNLSLRTAVQAFRREEDLQMYKASKRRRERLEQDKGTYGDSSFLDSPRGRGVQFPFVVTDRVIIKGNKRTPQRFVGREAIVTTQCLNGWYVVKTLDNAESVKLQYRSLEKVPDNPSSKPIAEKATSNWL